MRSQDVQNLVDTLPTDVARRIEAGEPVTLVVTKENGRLEMREIDPKQAWFWTPDWQEGEREADAQIVAGAGTTYDSGEEFIAALEADLKLPE